MDDAMSKVYLPPRHFVPGEGVVETSAARYVSPIPEEVRLRAAESFGGAAISEESFIMDAKDEVTVYADTQRGLFYGATALRQRSTGGLIARGFSLDTPVCPVRGVKVYLPGRQGIEDFKHFADMAAHYRYNTIMIEVGGAMEYRRHPEINEGWAEYCSEISEYSGKASQIQDHTFGWKKNSMHVENGEGSYLTQDEVRDLVAYCRARSIDVVPEVPSLSHCDYLLTRHKELAERADDPYPDTYCPSNPLSYQLLFDVLDEVLEIFAPSAVNIGHDEYYSAGVCPRCQGKPADRIFVDDILNIKDYLGRRGVRTMMWGEKLLDARLPNGRPCGGAAIHLDYDSDKELQPIPAMFACADLLPKDLGIFHWYWEIDEAYDAEYTKRGFPAVYGNFCGSFFTHWQQRIAWGFLGGVISNWSAVRESNLQRNGAFFELVYGARMFWDDRYKDGQHDALREEVFDELFRYRHYEALQRSKGSSGNCSYVSVLHTAKRLEPYHMFYDGFFIEPEKELAGYYRLHYGDGTHADVPVRYGSHISGINVPWVRREMRLIEASFSTRPMCLPDGTWNRWIFENPCPDKAITAVEAVNLENREPILVKEIAFL